MTAQPETAEQGGYAVIALRVPTESDTAGRGRAMSELASESMSQRPREAPAERSEAVR